MIDGKNKFYLGIDLGTSSAKAIARSVSGEYVKVKVPYESETPSGWRRAVKDLISELKAKLTGEIAAVSFSSQVGTYVINGCDTISWKDSVGREELDFIKSEISNEEFLNSIGMRHPDLISYPIPRLLYAQKHYGENARVLMPKELLIQALTGECVTDVFSMRGIAHPEKALYANDILQRLGITLALPTLKKPCDLAGRVSESAEREFSLKKGTPVFLGCNDFFAGLLGMGIYETGKAFDLSGTSEHVGYVSDEINPEGFVSGGYFNGFCTYGGTKASGTSCSFAMQNFGLDGIELSKILAEKPPVFLPYLSGERAPVFDENARGVFFGINEKTDKKALSYAVLEGVVFSLFDIAKSMNMPRPTELICGGGSARDSLMNTLRATAFDCPTQSVVENDTSALGASIIAMVSSGVYPSFPAAISECVKYLPTVNPDERYRDILERRFEVYQDLYKSLKNTFKKHNIF